MDKVICIVGPTAVGKTKMSIKLAQEFDGECISADSMQVYKGLDIGTAKVSKAEMCGIKHHLIDIRDIDQSYDVVSFVKETRELIKSLNKAGKMPIVVGGTGQYIKSLLFDNNTTAPARDPLFKDKYKDLSNEQLHAKLAEFDLESANILHPNNRRRVERAIEVYEVTGITKSKHQEMQSLMPIFNHLIIGLNTNRETLYERIDNRVDQMIEENLVLEVQNALKKVDKDAQSMSGIGYKEIIPHIESDYPIKKAIITLKQNSRNFAKRQITWFNNQLETKWFETNYDDFNITIEEVKKYIINEFSGQCCSDF